MRSRFHSEIAEGRPRNSHNRINTKMLYGIVYSQSIVTNIWSVSFPDDEHSDDAFKHECAFFKKNII